MDDKSMLHRISELVGEERELRMRLATGQISADEEHARLRELEESLDQAWDLLRRRRAAREFGNDPDAERARTAGEVEGYLQ
jgi:hypothetical protein